jgi:general secretion pathway protein F/type IV pilus assembly protein PilC
MNYFKYKLIQPTGQVVSGITKLPYQDEIAAMAYLERGQNTAVYAKKLGQLASWIIRAFSMRPKSRVSRPFQAEFLSNVSLMLRTGIPLTKALTEAANTADHPRFGKDIKNIVYDIENGAKFSEAAEKHPHIFPYTVIRLIGIGEETGQLDKMFMDASDHITRVHKIASDTRQALMYPSFVIFSITGCFLFWFYYVVPKIVGLFREMDVSLPTLTVVVLQVSNVVKTHLLSILICIAAVVFVFVAACKAYRKVRKARDILLLHLPVSRSIVSASALAFVSEYLSLLLNAGVDIVQAVTIIKDSIKNELYRERLTLIGKGLAAGDGIAESFQRATVFPSFVVRMVKVGEESGTLPEQLTHIADNYRNKLSVVVSTLGKIIEPAVLVIAGTMFAVIIGGLFLPIYDLVSKLSG